MAGPSVTPQTVAHDPRPRPAIDIHPSAVREGYAVTRVANGWILKFERGGGTLVFHHHHEMIAWLLELHNDAEANNGRGLPPPPLR